MFKKQPPKKVVKAKKEEEALPDAEEKEKAEPAVLVRGAEKADIKAVKPDPVQPFVGPKQKVFECPQGCLVVGPEEKGTATCPTHGGSINPKR